MCVRKRERKKSARVYVCVREKKVRVCVIDVEMRNSIDVSSIFKWDWKQTLNNDAIKKF